MADVHSRRVKAPYASTSHEKPSSREWTLESLLKKGKNFAEVPRVRWSPEKSTLDQIQEHENASKGVPLVIEGLDRHENWHEDTFTLDCFESDGTKEICVRNVHDRSDQNMLLSEFVARTHEASPFVTPGEDVRLYGKDIQCPRKWNDWLHSANVIPSCLLPKGSNNLLKNLPPSMQVETLMCYLGIGDTFTPCHKDLCASSGHNLMCRTENGGSSFWFMTDTASANTVATFFHEKLKVELDHESHVITLAELMNAPFKVYITEQKLGDLVLVPPRSAHQVWNHGGLTVKTSWSRMTPDGLSLALRYELPLYRRVCRSETYRVKSIIYHTLRDLLSNEPDSSTTPGSTTYVQMNTRHSSMRFETLLHVLKLFDCVLIEEYSQDPKQLLKLLPRLDKSSTINPGDDENERGLTCDFCGSDVFQSFFECRSCVDGGKAELGHGFVTCPGCYVEGRSCRCEVMEPMQCHSFDQLLQLRQRATALIKTWKSDVPVPPTE
ncbi:hypothetical protein B0H10DRAFT_2331770 [Mycena sp. CBHHK59/15]|nr:hypothetical protein B0H10DRAFT_2331770 [Mycena sp. CBHHK59/15]